MLNLNGLTKFYGALPAIRDITVSLAPGDVLGLLGPNGSGKSTTVKMLVGLLTPTRGTIAYRDRDVGEDVTGFKSLIG